MTEFSQLGLSPMTLQAVADTGYTIATPIQAQAIPVALAGRDVLGIAQTGTGKTAAFTLPLVERLSTGRARARMPRALVLAPTRELADQVAESFAKYAKGTKLTWVLLIGGVSMGDQVAALNKGVDVLIATPGRLIDLFERGKMMLNGVEIMVVDEADRMLDMGFIPDIEKIFKLTPPKRQTLFFSATMPPEITRLTTQFLKDPTRIEASRPAATADTITQYLVRIPSSDPKMKRAALRTLIGRADVRNGIVFCNRKSEVDVVAKSLKQHGFDAAPIHGDLDQSLRTKTLAAFRSGELKLLVASDVAARGLDIPDVSHVFNYDVSHHADDYVHRIGRTGRAGKLGQTFMIVTPGDDKSLDKVLKLIKMDPQELVLDPADLGGPVRSFARAEKPAPAPAAAAAGTAEAPKAGRSRRKTVVETPVADEIAASPVVQSDGAATEAPAPSAAEPTDKPIGRSRSRRGRRGSEPTEAAPVAKVVEEAPAPASAPIVAAQAVERPAQKAHLRQSDRQSDRKSGRAAEADDTVPERSNGRPFGENEIPAFLRRTTLTKS